ncbi:GNAT family N-acetyltransferase [Pseudomonas monteilii]|uniref:GNAT family N-acetyltransferase n=1 Tax=Pseudomonas TaxID=286 RepID=UPI0018E6AFE3|nr:MULTISPECIES: GNAT family N-acetyltransferase [Pseudomonas]MBI6919178.1 GNAT family N-acetyltransferase [Pseudomonas monteilii]MCE0939006.1 GNAT family N-acetyltransferase [Pseudomonas kurunegalensis]
MLQNQSVLARIGRKPHVHSERDQVRRRQAWLEACLPAALYRRLFIRRLSSHPLAIEGFSFRPVQNLYELEQALRLVNDSYARRGIATVCRAGMRFSPFHLLPGTTTFVALKGDQVVGTVSLIEDSPLGLPLEDVHVNEAVLQRLGGGRLAEVGTLAVCSHYKGKGVPLMLYNAMFRWAMDHRRVNSLLIAVHPRAASFYRNVLFFSPIGPVQTYTKLNKALSLPLALNLNQARQVFAKVYQHPGLGFTVEQQHTDLFDFFCARHFPHIQLPVAPPQTHWSTDEVLTHMARCGTSPRHLTPRVRRVLQLD